MGNTACTGRSRERNVSNSTSSISRVRHLAAAAAFGAVLVLGAAMLARRAHPWVTVVTVFAVIALSDAVGVGQGLRTGGRDHLGERLPVVVVAVGRDDRGDAVVADHLEQTVGLVGRVDEDLLTRLRAAQQVAVVLVGPDGELRDGEGGELTDVGTAADADVSGVGHGPIMPRPARGHQQGSGGRQGSSRDLTGGSPPPR